ncbi:hypothetical protein HYZ97_04095 [Candidatus Pacearchaeota archaeon]|nr:hypothetical protein [Candidatus Pacearchaeota archaeon]
MNLELKSLREMFNHTQVCILTADKQRLKAIEEGTDFLSPSKAQALYLGSGRLPGGETTLHFFAYRPFAGSKAVVVGLHEFVLVDNLVVYNQIILSQGTPSESEEYLRSRGI